MNITDYIEECRKQRHDLSFAFLAERCPASEEAPYRIKPCSPIAPDENCVLILAGTGGRNVNLRGYNSILKKTDNFVKQNIDSSIVPVRTCVAICDFGKRHLDNIARKGAYFEAWWPQHIAALKHDIPENCIEETLILCILKTSSIIQFYPALRLRTATIVYPSVKPERISGI